MPVCDTKTQKNVITLLSTHETFRSILLSAPKYSHGTFERYRRWKFWVLSDWVLLLFGGGKKKIIHSRLTPAHASPSGNYYYTEHLDCVLTMCYWVRELKGYMEQVLHSETSVSCGGNVWNILTYGQTVHGPLSVILALVLLLANTFPVQKKKHWYTLIWKYWCKENMGFVQQSTMDCQLTYCTSWRL